MRPLSIAVLVLTLSTTAAVAQPATPTAADAAAFVEAANAEIADLAERAGHAQWVQQTYISYDTELLAAQANEKLIARAVELAKEAKRFDGVEADPLVRRQLEVMKRAITLPAPADPALTRELTQIAAGMDSNYGSATWCPEGVEPGTPAAEEQCRNVVHFTRIHAESRDPEELLEAWVQWRTTSRPIRDDYQRFVELANQGARELGYADLGAMWRSNYDMTPEAFAAELERLWGEMRPLYEALHCHVRAKLAERYGESAVPAGEPIPAHLLGNIWAQSWANIYDLVGPGESTASYDLTKLLTDNAYDPIKMVKTGEAFFTSLGQPPLPETFWQRSLFTKPRDREVVCHASAWNVDNVDDLRIKMCIEINAEDFQTIHHELGHNFYQRAYNHQPMILRDSANDGFHEALGDAIGLAVTPAYLKQLGLIAEEPPASEDLGLLLRAALDKVAFLPFGLLIDQWRWKVFSGEIGPDEYNAGWWELRERYQGVKAPVVRTEEDFDPGAKYHVPGNTPYTRYFLAHVLEFQFFKAMCDAAGYQGPLHRCTFFGSQEAGDKLDAMMQLGLSKPWPEALEVMTGQRQIDAGPLLDYFAPLAAWLEEQNEGRVCGW